MAQLGVCTPTRLVRHLDGKHALLVFIGLPVQAIVNVVLVVLTCIRIGIRPEVTLIADETEATVLDTILEPGSHL